MEKCLNAIFITFQDQHQKTTETKKSQHILIYGFALSNICRHIKTTSNLLLNVKKSNSEEFANNKYHKPHNFLILNQTQITPRLYT